MSPLNWDSNFTPQPDSLFGRLIAAADVEDALQVSLEQTIEDYLCEVERQHGIEVGTLERPRSWVVSADVEKFVEDQLPAVIIASPGTDAEPPIADGQGRYLAKWNLDVAVHIAARAEREALRLARYYALAIRAAALQQASPLFVGVDWLGESYDLLDSSSDRSICNARVRLAVQVAEVVNRNAGPPGYWPESGTGEPESPEWPVAESADVEIVKVPIEGEL